LVEVALVFAVFFVQGAAPVPDVNEPYYLGKAIHFWNSDWIRGDFFLKSADTHSVFYFTLGWLSRWLSPTALAWTGRLLTWVLLAWAWRRLSFAIVPRPWCSVLTAAVFVCLSEHCHMAGEWVLGGVEAKGFAYVLVLLGIEALVRNRWNRAWLLLGAAAAFHVLVGGWSVVAAGIAWLVLGKDRPALRSMWPALLGGFVLSLPGLLPSLLLHRGTDAAVVAAANQIYVYQRLAHHLDIQQIPAWFVFRFALLSALWLVICLLTPAQAASRRLRAFAAGTLVIVLAGLLLTPLAYLDRALGAALLRFYWYRLADVAIPLAAAFAAVEFITRELGRRSAGGKVWLVAAILLVAGHLGAHVARCVVPRPPPAYRLANPRSPHYAMHYRAWRRACDWIADSGEIPPEARFLTPRMNQTFKWYARRAEVANWKEIPQDATAIVEWRRRIRDLCAAGSKGPLPRGLDSLAERRAWRLRQAGAKYGTDYAITFTRPRLPLEAVYTNRVYTIYRLR